MQYVGLTLTDSQVSLVRASLMNAETDAVDEVERGQLQGLVMFFAAIEQNPAAFPPPPAMARAIRKRLSRMKGSPQPKPNKRKRAQLRSQSGQKRTRAEKREAARIQREAFQAAQEALDIERALEDRQRAEALGIVLPE